MRAEKELSDYLPLVTIPYNLDRKRWVRYNVIMISGFKDMVRYYHSEGSAVMGDNAQENEKLWGLLSEVTGGSIGGIPVETYKKIGQGQSPRIEMKSAEQAMNMAEVMNDFQAGRLFKATWRLLWLPK